MHKLVVSSISILCAITCASCSIVTGSSSNQNYNYSSDINSDINYENISDNEYESIGQSVKISFDPISLISTKKVSRNEIIKIYVSDTVSRLSVNGAHYLVNHDDTDGSYILFTVDEQTPYMLLIENIVLTGGETIERYGELYLSFIEDTLIDENAENTSTDTEDIVDPSIKDTDATDSDPPVVNAQVKAEENNAIAMDISIDDPHDDFISAYIRLEHDGTSITKDLSVGTNTYLIDDFATADNTSWTVIVEYKTPTGPVTATLASGVITIEKSTPSETEIIYVPPQAESEAKIESARDIAITVKITGDADSGHLIIKDSDGNTVTEENIDITQAQSSSGQELLIPYDSSTDYSWEVILDYISDKDGNRSTISPTSGSIELAQKIEYAGALSVRFMRLDEDGAVKNVQVITPDNYADNTYVARVTLTDGTYRFAPVIGVEQDGDEYLVHLEQEDAINYQAGDDQPSQGFIIRVNTHGILMPLDRLGDRIDTIVFFANLYKLAPYMDQERILRDSSLIPRDSILRTRVIDMILPLDASGNLVTYLDANEPDRVASLKVTFKNKSSIEIPVTYQRTQGDIATYRDLDTGIWYQPKMFLIQGDSTYVQNLLSSLQSVDTSSLVRSNDTEFNKTLLVEHWSTYKNDGLEDDLKAALSSSALTNISFSNPIMDAVRNEYFPQDTYLSSLAAILNWNSRMFSFDFNGIKMSDLYLSQRGFDTYRQASIKDVLDRYSANGLSNWQYFMGHAGRWARELYAPDAHYRFRNMQEVAEYFIYTLTSYGDDYDGWLRAKWGGSIYTPTGATGYTSWSNLNIWKTGNVLASYGHRLPALLTVPGKDMYYIALPGTVLFGQKSSYTGKTEAQFDVLAQNFSNTAYRWMINLDKINPGYMDDLLARSYTGWDTRYVSGVSKANSDANYPYLHDFASLVGGALTSGNFAGYAIGADMHFTYRAVELIGLFTHEFVHVSDDRGPLFGANTAWRNYGGRFLGAETSTTNVFEQSFNYSSFAPNLINAYSPSGTTTDSQYKWMSNWNYERINSPEKYQDYYHKLFEALNILDYIQAKAYLKLDWGQQQKLGSKLFYLSNKNELLSDDASTDPLARVNSQWVHLDVLSYEDPSFTQIPLNSIEDLWDQRISVNPNFSSQARVTFTNNSYSSIPGVSAQWYIPHNDYGVSDGVTAKYLAFMMAGEAGWEGTMNVLTGNRTDLDVLRQSTGDSDITWREYKLKQYAAIEEKYGATLEPIIDEMVTAYKTDADSRVAYASNKNKNWVYTNSMAKRLALYANMKNITSDFTTSVFDVEWSDYLVSSP